MFPPDRKLLRPEAVSLCLTHPDALSAKLSMWKGLNTHLLDFIMLNYLSWGITEQNGTKAGAEAWRQWAHLGSVTLVSL